ncbi:MAG: hypothetical protein COU70_02010 [Parcubacteria group bacterium CG10_big_fil_rev_8_21_14_0_10_35_15]|nr:MAG: hypothetical protein COU70_02010 [Parcubacteria group bacterium CG10_big_fil_rev_8_21_14_0_10_35_15]
MEISNKLKNIYRHWEYHIDNPFLAASRKIDLDKSYLDQIGKFAIERMKIWEKVEQGLAQPFTADPVLQRYRFCNIYRELDKQTIEYHKLLHNIRKDFDLWLLNMMFCRLICRYETIKHVGLLCYNRKNNEKVFGRLKTLPSPKYGTAYVFPISVIMKSEFPSRERFFCFYLPEIMKSCAEVVRSFDRAGVADAVERVLPVFKYNLRFHWTEVLIDVAYQYPQYIDLFKRFPIGPGSKPMMEMLNKTVNPEEICLALTRTDLKGFPYLFYKGKRVWLSPENWEGICCEFRKYYNLRHGTGRKRIFTYTT